MGCGPDNYEVRESQADSILKTLKKGRPASAYDLGVRAGYAPSSSIRRAIGTLRALGHRITTRYNKDWAAYEYRLVP